jgi:hypothetical protein
MVQGKKKSPMKSKNTIVQSADEVLMKLLLDVTKITKHTNA